MKLIQIPKGVEYSETPQGSPDWVTLRVGRIGASQLGAWLAISKRDGKPLKARTDLEHEIAFEKAFDVPFTRYVTDAMQQGIDNEDFVRQEYAARTGNEVKQVGAFYDDYSVASPDGLIGKDGGLEIKWLQDSNWTKVAISGEPLAEHALQIQGNLRLSGRKWWDYVAANGNTGRFIVLRIERDEAVIEQIDEAVKEVKNVKPLKVDNVYAFQTEAPKQEESIWK